MYKYIELQVFINGESMNISKILAQTQTGFARPNLFRVLIDRARSDMETLSINCFQAQIPGTNILTTDRDIGLRQMSYQRAYADMMMGFYCSGDLKELKFFQNWINDIVNPNNNHMAYYGGNHIAGEEPGYTSNVIIEQFRRDAIGATGTGRTSASQGVLENFDTRNKIAARWTLREAFPKQVDPVQLDYGTNDTYMAVTITMTFRKFEVNYSPRQDYGNDELSKEAKYARDVLGQKSGRQNMLGPFHPQYNKS